MTCLCNQVGLVVHPLDPKVSANKTMFIWTKGFWANLWLIFAKMNKRPLINQNTRSFLNGTTFNLAMGPAPKCHFPTVGTSATLGPITLCVNLRLRSGPKQSCSPCRELFNDMSHATCTLGNRGDSWLLVVKNQIANFILGPFFGHNLCVECSNGSCEPILNIYVPRAFAWYKELLNPMGFYPCDRSLKVRESIRTPTPKVGMDLGVWGFIPSHSLTLSGAWDVIPALPSWPAHLQALTLITSPRLGLWHIWLMFVDKVYSNSFFTIEWRHLLCISSIKPTRMCFWL
jgi:hypothetical protein